jgi:predicted metalloprotease with PDZ domain
VKSVAVSLFALALSAGFASAQASEGPQPLPANPEIPAPEDVAYPGVIKLSVDATDTDRRIFRVRETIPVAGPGPITLLYPKWLPGNHAPRGPLDQMGGLIVTANGKRVEWTRDTADAYAFHLDVPAGATALDIEFQFLSPTDTRMGRVVVTPDMLNLQWNAVALYPAGYFTRRITVEPTVTLPAGWKFGTALETASASGSSTTFKPVPFETLVDSPMFAGRYYKQVDLDPNGPVPVRLNIVADKPEQLEIKPEQLTQHRNLIQQAYKLYGSHHYDHYDFLFALTDEMSGIGLEHHRSSENGVGGEYFTDWSKSVGDHDLLPHEYTHSWNGKFRRGADLWTANYSVPMRDSLLWVYEGQTQYWGNVLAARSGLVTREQALDDLASVAAAYDARVGRAWKPLQDTTNDPIVSARRPQSWKSWQRSEDYYSEGQLVWLDADTLIRELSGGKKSLDDFAKAFFGVKNGSYVPETYDFDEVVRTLNSVQPYDWATFLRTRLDGHGPGAPLDGLARGGYRLVYTDTPSDLFKTAESNSKSTSLTYSIGMSIGRDGAITDVQWDGPAYKAGLIVGTNVVAVNGRAYSGDGIKDAVRKAKDGGPIELIVKNGDRYRTVKIQWTGGLRYPHLERINKDKPAALDAILTPRK